VHDPHVKVVGQWRVVLSLPDSIEMILLLVLLYSGQ
jgi:hypothetical protein